MSEWEIDTPEEGGALEIVNPASAASHWVDRLAEDAHRLVASLPGYTDEELIAFRETAERLYKVSWVAICAVDHEIMSRAQRISHKRAGDLSQQGIYATAVRGARALGGVSPATILRNAQIYANFGDILTNPDGASENARLAFLLPDKGFWDAAAHAPDGQMWQALQYFADQKEADIRFSTRDAYRWVREQKAPPLTSLIPSLADDEEVKTALVALDAAFAELSRVTADRLAPILRGYREEIREELQLPPMSVLERIAQLLEDGYDEVDIIRDRIAGDRNHVIAWLRQMVDQDWVRPFEKHRIEGARGAARTGYAPTPRLAQAIRALKREQIESDLPDLRPNFSALVE
jgi:hypothetical protein